MKLETTNKQSIKEPGARFYNEMILGNVDFMIIFPARIVTIMLYCSIFARRSKIVLTGSTGTFLNNRSFFGLGYEYF